MISEKTLKLLSGLYSYTFYDKLTNEVEQDRAETIHIGFQKCENPYYIGVSIKLLKKKEMDLDYILAKINFKSEYENMTSKFNQLIKNKNINAYATTYGIGVWSYMGFSDQDKLEVDNLLNSLGIVFSREYSDAGWVLRYRISKSVKNLKRLEM